MSDDAEIRGGALGLILALLVSAAAWVAIVVVVVGLLH
jgi:hypothetical protein